jgi:hypothetical protein
MGLKVIVKESQWVKLNTHNLNKILSPGNAGITRKQLRILKDNGSKGWRRRLIDKWVTKKDYERLIRLREAQNNPAEMPISYIDNNKEYNKQDCVSSIVVIIGVYKSNRIKYILHNISPKDALNIINSNPISYEQVYISSTK